MPTKIRKKSSKSSKPSWSYRRIRDGEMGDISGYLVVHKSGYYIPVPEAGNDEQTMSIVRQIIRAKIRIKDPLRCGRNFQGEVCNVLYIQGALLPARLQQIMTLEHGFSLKEYSQTISALKVGDCKIEMVGGEYKLNSRGRSKVVRENLERAERTTA